MDLRPVQPRHTDQHRPRRAATGGYANGEDGYYVRRYVYSALASVRAVQRAQYVEDN